MYICKRKKSKSFLISYLITVILSKPDYRNYRLSQRKLKGQAQLAFCK